MNENSNSNHAQAAEAAESKPSLLSLLVKRHEEEKGGKLPSQKERARLIKEYEVARRNVDEAKKAFEAAQQVSSNAAGAMVLAFGGRQVKLSGGQLVRPMSRGETVFYRGFKASDDVVSG